MEHVNPILQRVREGRPSDQPVRSNYIVPASPGSQKSVPPLVKKLIGELGLRYRPSNQADMEEHAAGLALLCVDVSDVPPSLLEAACVEHARTSRFMPKAAELIDLAKQIQAKRVKGTDNGADQLQAHCDRLNALNNGREGWHVVGITPNRTIAKRRDHIEKPS